MQRSSPLHNVEVPAIILKTLLHINKTFPTPNSHPTHTQLELCAHNKPKEYLSILETKPSRCRIRKNCNPPRLIASLSGTLGCDFRRSLVSA